MATLKKPISNFLITLFLAIMVEQKACFVPAGKKALEVSKEKQSFELPHLIFLDINMPEMNGWQCLAE